MSTSLPLSHFLTFSQVAGCTLSPSLLLATSLPGLVMTRASLWSTGVVERTSMCWFPSLPPSLISFIHFLFPVLRIATVKHKYLAYVACQFVTESSVVAAGYDCYPVLWSHDDNNQLTYINQLDSREKKETSGHLRWVSRGCDPHALLYLSLSVLWRSSRVSISGLLQLLLMYRWTPPTRTPSRQCLVCTCYITTTIMCVHVWYMSSNAIICSTFLDFSSSW